MATRKCFGSPAAVAFAGMLSLAVGVGIGRFAFTPMLPLMLHDGQVDVAAGGWLAAANYLGYLVGALSAPRMTSGSARLGLASLLAVAVSTALMAADGFPLWLGVRFAAGVFSAWVFVATSVWCLGTLAREHRADLGGWTYAGVGLGIVAAGLYCLAAGVLGVNASRAWMALALLALVLTIPVVLVLRAIEAPALGGPAAGSPRAALPAGTVGLVACYGVMGLGYILPATFLPVMARAVVSDPATFGLAWPLYGLTAAASTLAAIPLMRRSSRLQVWAVSQFLMGIGALLPSLAATASTIFVAAVLVGGTFMVITLAGVQEIRARAPAHAGPWVGYMTAAFALGQIAGPAASALLLAYPPVAARALPLGLQAAAAALFLSAAWLWRQAIPATTRKELTNA